MTVQKMITETQATQLKNLASADQAVEAILLMLTLRKRNMGTTNLYRFKSNMEDEGFTFTDEIYEKAWDQLASLGLGAIIRPRKNRFNAEFVWNYNLVDVANQTFDQGKIEQFKKDHTPAANTAKEITAPVIKAKGKRGRPIGSKNKVKKAKVVRAKRGRPEGLKMLTSKEAKIITKILQKLVS